MPKIIYLAFILAMLAGCKENNSDVQSIVDQAILTAGSDFDKVAIEFSFRDKEYGAKFQNGRFEYVRLFKDSTLLYHDMLTNETFTRKINGEEIQVPDSMASKYSNSINSVIYFALLPKGLNDAAVNKEYIGTTVIHEKEYHKISITFNEDGGGEDFQDKFIYWIDTETHAIDYIAYQYYTDGGGFRFRKAYNIRAVDGIKFVDYINYKPTNREATKLEDLDSDFIKGNLEELSRIELKNIQVQRL